ncbi:MAG: alpha/beta hydrolase [Lapillicoccus sp.]
MTPPDEPGLPAAVAPPPARTIAYGSDPAQVYDVRLPAGTAAGTAAGASPTTSPTSTGTTPTGTTVVIVHGGFWRQEYDRAHAAGQAQAFADAGHHVAVVEYRRVSMPGGGWPGTFDDVAAAIEAIRADPTLPDRCVLVGHSAGGHLVTLAASQPWAHGIRGAVSLAGCVDLVRGVELGMGGTAVPDFLGAAPATDASAPLAAADPALTTPAVPVVLIHGDADDVVPLEVSRSYLAKVESSTAQHAAVRLLPLPGADHSVLIDPADPAFAVVLREVASLTQD